MHEHIFRSFLVQSIFEWKRQMSHVYTKKGQSVHRKGSVCLKSRYEVKFWMRYFWNTALYLHAWNISYLPRITKLGEFPRYVKSLRQGIALSNCYLSSNLLCIPKLITDDMSLHSIVKSSETTTNNLNCDFKGRSKMGFPVKNYFRNPDLSKKI